MMEEKKTREKTQRPNEETWHGNQWNESRTANPVGKEKNEDYQRK